MDESLKILLEHRNKDFVRRILYPANTGIKNASGDNMSHFMTYNETDGVYNVFPRVQRDGNGFKFLGEKEAWERAKKNGEFISFKSQKEADSFSNDSGYKKYFGFGNIIEFGQNPYMDALKVLMNDRQR